jgi:hypothetical protein
MTGKDVPPERGSKKFLQAGQKAEEMEMVHSPSSWVLRGENEFSEFSVTCHFLPCSVLKMTYSEKY